MIAGRSMTSSTSSTMPMTSIRSMTASRSTRATAASRSTVATTASRSTRSMMPRCRPARRRRRGRRSPGPSGSTRWPRRGRPARRRRRGRRAPPRHPGRPGHGGIEVDGGHDLVEVDVLLDEASEVEPFHDHRDDDRDPYVEQRLDLPRQLLAVDASRCWRARRPRWPGGTGSAPAAGARAAGSPGRPPGARCAPPRRRPPRSRRPRRGRRRAPSVPRAPAGAPRPDVLTSPAPWTPASLSLEASCPGTVPVGRRERQGLPRNAAGFTRQG